jgi:hypothetical protein
LEFVEGDKQAVQEAVNGATTVHHNQAMVRLAKGKDAFWSINSNVTLNLLEPALAADVAKVVYTPSSAVFDVPEQLPADEYVTPRPAETFILAAGRPGPRAYNVGAERFGTMRQTLQSRVAHAGAGSKVRSVLSAPAVAVIKLTSALGVSPLGAYHSLMYGKDMYFDGARGTWLVGTLQ